MERREGREEILIRATIRQAELFSERLKMKREWRCPIGEYPLSDRYYPQLWGYGDAAYDPLSHEHGVSDFERGSDPLYSF